MNKQKILILLISALFFLLSGNSWAISAEERYRVSRELEREITQKYGAIIPVSSNNPMGKIFNSLVKNTDRRDVRYKLSYVRTSTVNAVTLPDGHVIIFTGLLNILPQNDSRAIAFILAHEISHAEKKHLEKKINQALVTGTVIGILTGGSDQFVRILGVVVQNLLVSGYSRDMETEADIGGLELMRKSGFDPRGGLIAMNTLENQERKNPQVRIFPTHPLSSDRKKNIENWLMERSYIKNGKADS
jgi:predicted Zn-dependent protease